MQLVRCIVSNVHVYCEQRCIITACLWVHFTRRCYDIGKVLCNNASVLCADLILITTKQPVINSRPINLLLQPQYKPCSIYIVTSIRQRDQVH